MTGMFELFTDSDTSYRFRLTAPDGTIMALSKPFPDKRSAVAGIAAVREYAGMGHVTEIAKPQNDATDQPVAGRLPQTAGMHRGTHEARSVEARSVETHARGRSVGGGASGSPGRPPRIRIPSAARFLGGRAVVRNQQLIVRWRQALEPQTGEVGLSSC
ncbi:YegP family protein [Arthrobacter sp. NPDC058130]|uniref:YegP family protein n=1 Tax=Arthrobacter sp. NPDC058130 TaxID=3346353 RepID=UPI0036ED1046